jgi:hypothetical protein
MSENITTKNIQYVSAACGAGKTHIICDEIATNPYKKYIIVVPTIKLGEDYQSGLQDRGVTYKECINSSSPKNVAKRIEKSIISLNSMDVGGVIIITQSALSTAKFLQHVDTWHLIIDEILTVDRLIPFPTPHTLSILTDSVSVDEKFKHKTLYKLKHDDAVLNLQYDENLKSVKKLVSDMDTYHEAFVEKNNWDNMVVDGIVTPDTESDMTYGNQNNTLNILLMLTSKIVDQFKSVTILGANFESSMLYKWWSESFSVQFTPNNHLLGKLRYTTHNNGHRLYISYLSEVNFSKTYRNKPIDEVIDGTTCKSIGEKLSAKAVDALESGFIYMINKDSCDDVLINAGGVKANVISHGSNAFSGYHQLYFSAAVNKNPAHNRILNGLDFTDDFIFTATTAEISYQGLMRTSLRDINCNVPVHFVCNDYRTATGVAEYFPGCRVMEAKDVIKKYVPLTQAQRNVRAKVTKLLKTDNSTYSAFELVGLLCKVARNHIVNSNEQPKVLPKIALTDNYCTISINFTGSIDNFNTLAKEHRLSSVTYSVKDAIGYTANIIMKNTGTAYDANVALIPMLTSNGIDVYGFDAYVPSRHADDSPELYRINCDKTSVLENHATCI